MFGKNKEGDGLVKSVLLAYFILALHVLLLAGVVVLVLFFRGVVSYMLWISLGGIALIGFSAFYFIRRMRAEGKSLREMLRNPMFNGRSVEVSLLGGMATVKLGQSSQPPTIGHDAAIDIPRLEDPDASRSREVSELAELARLLEKDLITVDEFNKAKRQFFNS
ncbi:MAG: SHOCT domain-containing protein [Desulfosarcina sp.]|nr:SHOCT domain-containing protein [Desulfosarcina sp.]MBC2743946.1 SHOCT domain-containing protein [Desulfosarcina sp.]MBC2766855.1 SHOCT domain-containing protein [Desulfosarcina sp.]